MRKHRSVVILKSRDFHNLLPYMDSTKNLNFEIWVKKHGSIMILIDGDQEIFVIFFLIAISFLIGSCQEFKFWKWGSTIRKLRDFRNLLYLNVAFSFLVWILLYLDIMISFLVWILSSFKFKILNIDKEASMIRKSRDSRSLLPHLNVAISFPLWIRYLDLAISFLI